MKAIISGVALVTMAICVYLFCAKQEHNVQVTIIDECGDPIWPLPNAEAEVFRAVMHGQDVVLDVEFDHLFLEYLQNMGAAKVVLTKVEDGATLATYPIQAYQLMEQELKPKSVEKSMTDAAYAAYVKNMEADPDYKSKPENPSERELWRLSQKGGELNPQKMLKAMRHTKSLVNERLAQKDAGIMSWTSLGPGNIGGRIRSIAIDPNDEDRIFIGSVAGGIWRTTNGGSNWTNVSDILPNMCITQIVFDPSNSDIMYASTGEGIGGAGIARSSQSPGAMNIGVGVMRSTDGGVTWNVLPQPNDRFHWVNDIAIDPNNPTHLWAVTSDTTDRNSSFGSGAIYKSINSGQSWVEITTTESRAIDIKIDPNNSNRLMVGCRGHLYRSTNGTYALNDIDFFEITGSTNQPPSGGRIEIAYAPSVSNRVYALVDQNYGEVWRSENGGSTWTKRNASPLSTFGTSGSGQGWYDNVIWVDPFSSQRIVIGGIDTWRSTNGGQTFTKISDWNDGIHQEDNDGDGMQNTSLHADQHVIVESPNYSNANRKVFIGNDGGIFKTDNITSVSQNSGWDNLNNNLRITQFYGGAASADRSLVIGGAQDNSFIVDRSFGGTTWVVPVSGDGAFAAVDYNNENNAFANTNFNQIFRSTDNGQTWSWIAGFRHGGCGSTGCASGGVFRVQDGASLISKFTMDPNTPTTIYACANSLWRNNNSGNPNNWTNIRNANGGQITAMDVGSNSNRIWIGTVNGRVEMSNTGGGTAGTSWTQLDNDVDNPMPDRFVTDIAVDPQNQDRVMVTIGGYGQDNIWYTNNNGATWNNRSLDFDMQVNSVVWHPDRTGWVYIGTDFGIFASSNYGQDWSVIPIREVNDGPFNGEVAEVFFAGDGSDNAPYYLYAASHARGMWRTSFPVRDAIYVDKNYNGVERGSITQPYNTFEEAVDAAGSGSKIIFLSSGTHDESSNILLNRKVIIRLQNGGSSVLIK